MNGLEVLLLLAGAVACGLLCRHLWIVDREEAQRAKWRDDHDTLREWEPAETATHATFPRVVP